MESAHQHVEQVHEQKDAAASGGDAEQARRPSYGATGLPVHGRASARGGRRLPRRTGGEGHPRLTGVPEGDEETDEGWERENRRGARGGSSTLATVPPRMFFSLLALPVLAPLVVLGPQLGKDALVVPATIPVHRWSTNSAGPNLVKGAHLAQISQHGLKKLSAQQVQLDAKDLGKAVSEAVAKGGGDDLLRTFGSVVRGDDAMVMGPSGPEDARMQQTQQGPEIIRAGRTSIWNYGPFVFTLGVMVSILAKMLIAQPLAKVGTDMLLMWAGTQEQAQDSEQYYGYVYLERDEEFGGPTPRSNGSQRARNSTPAVNSSRTLASEAVTPRRGSFGDASMSRGSVDSKRSSSGKKKWPVTLDLPDHRGTFGASNPQQAQPAMHGAAETPLPVLSPEVLSPESALTSPGETLIGDLDGSAGPGAQV